MTLAITRPRLSVRVRHYVQTAGVYIALLVIGAIFTFLSPYFLTSSNIQNILTQASNISILAAGLTIALIAGEIDLAVGSTQALAGSVAAILIIQHGFPFPLGIVVALGVGVLVGSINGYTTVAWKLPSFITTLAMLGIAQGTGLLLTNAQPVSGFPSAYDQIGGGHVGWVPIPVIIAAGVYLLCHMILSHTRLGIAIYAVGGGRSEARMVGIRTRRVVFQVFVISGLLAALGGVLLTARLDAGSGSYGANDLFDAVAAVIIGGTSLTGGVGTVVGTLGGMLIITTIRNGMVLLGVQAFWQQIVVGLIILIAVLIDQAVKGNITLSDAVLRGPRVSQKRRPRGELRDLD
jgi:ribose/xylose/arabinose/galactoside ABC-type transport system permease subunit